MERRSGSWPGPVAGLLARPRRAAVKHAQADVPVHLPTSVRLREHTATGRTRQQMARLLWLRLSVLTPCRLLAAARELGVARRDGGLGERVCVMRPYQCRHEDPASGKRPGQDECAARDLSPEPAD